MKCTVCRKNNIVIKMRLKNGLLPAPDLRNKSGVYTEFVPNSMHCPHCGYTRQVEKIIKKRG